MLTFHRHGDERSFCFLLCITPLCLFLLNSCIDLVMPWPSAAVTLNILIDFLSIQYILYWPSLGNRRQQSSIRIGLLQNINRLLK